VRRAWLSECFDLGFVSLTRRCPSGADDHAAIRSELVII
jgi:hypothetical protein